MQHMGCEPDRASYNILVDAYGKAGFQDGNYLSFNLCLADFLPFTHATLYISMKHRHSTGTGT